MRCGFLRGATAGNAFRQFILLIGVVSTASGAAAAGDRNGALQIHQRSTLSSKEEGSQKTDLQLLQFLPRSVEERYPTKGVIWADDKYLYIDVEASDARPDLVTAPTVRRDDVVGDQDQITVYIDTSGNKKAARFYRVNPSGSLSDGIYSEDSALEDRAPNFEFSAQARVHAEGWSARFAIPLDQLPGILTQDTRPRVQIIRSLIRNARYKLGLGGIIADASCFLCFGVPMQMVASGVGAVSDYEVTPYVFASSTKTRTAAAPLDANNTAETGVFAKYRTGSGLVLDGMVNPDFAQVEADDPKLSTNRRYSLYQEERRPFFFEGLDLYDQPIRLLQTRALNSPSWGARVTSTSASADFTGMAVRDQGGGVLLAPGPYYTNEIVLDRRSDLIAGRVRIPLSPMVTSGLTATVRSYEGAGSNKVIGADTTINASAAEKIKLQLASSQTEGGFADDGTPANRERRSSGVALHGEWQHESPTNGVQLWFDRVTRDFAADAGFVNQADYSAWKGLFEFRLSNVAGIERIRPYVYTNMTETLGGQQLTHSMQPGVTVDLPRNTIVTLEYRPAVHVRPSAERGLLRYSNWYVEVASNPASWLTAFNMSFQTGGQADYVHEDTGQGEAYELSATLRPTADLSVRFQQGFEYVRATGVGRLDDRYAKVTTVYAINSIDSVRLVASETRSRIGSAAGVEPNSSSRQTNLSLLWRSAPTSGLAYYVGLTRLIGTGDPLTQSNESEILFNVSYTFR